MCALHVEKVVAFSEWPSPLKSLGVQLMTEERISAIQSISLEGATPGCTSTRAPLRAQPGPRDAPMARWPIARNRVPAATCVVYLVGRWQLEVSRVRTRWFRGSLVLLATCPRARCSLEMRPPTLLPRPPFPCASLANAQFSLTRSSLQVPRSNPWRPMVAPR